MKFQKSISGSNNQSSEDLTGGKVERSNTMDDDTVLLSTTRNKTDYKERHLQIDTQANKLRILKKSTVQAGSPQQQHVSPNTEERKSANDGNAQSKKSSSDVFKVTGQFGECDFLRRQREQEGLTGYSDMSSIESREKLEFSESNSTPIGIQNTQKSASPELDQEAQAMNQLGLENIKVVTQQKLGQGLQLAQQNSAPFSDSSNEKHRLTIKKQAAVKMPKPTDDSLLDSESGLGGLQKSPNDKPPLNATFGKKIKKLRFPGE